MMVVGPHRVKARGLARAAPAQADQPRRSGLPSHVYLLAIVVVIAFVLRVSGLGARSFWLDEALVVRAARAPLSSLSAFVAQLDTSPILFALLERALLALPEPELSLRLPALIAGVASVLAVYALARALRCGVGVGVTAATLLAVNPTLAHYGKEAKPYAIDGLFALLAPLMVEWLLRRPVMGRWTAYGLLGVVPAFLYASPFTLLGCDLVLGWRFLRTPRAWPGLVLAGALHAAGGVLLYVLVLRQQMTGRLDQYWGGSFLPPTRSARVALAWIWERTVDLYRLYFESLPTAAILLTLVGLAVLTWQRRWRALGYILFPWGLIIVASAARAYPYGGHRVLLLLVPGIALAIAVALVLPLRLAPLGRRARAAAMAASVAAVAALAIPALWDSANRFVLRTYHAEEMRPVVAGMSRLVEPGDVVYLYYAAGPQWEWYGRGLPVRVVVGGYSRADVNGYGPEIDRVLLENRRTWLVFSHYYGQEREWMLARARAQGVEVAAFEDVGASAYLFERGP